jgi:hypothetical protein
MAPQLKFGFYPTEKIETELAVNANKRIVYTNIKTVMFLESKVWADNLTTIFELIV